MKNFLKILFTIICFFVIQCILEVICMSILAKAGVPYMGVQVSGESLIEVIEGISTYFLYSKIQYFVPAYFVLMITSVFYLSRFKKVRLKNIAVIHFVVNLVMFFVLWLGFGNGLRFIANPLLGLIIAATLTYFLSTKVRKPLIGPKND
jgi:hypothetical protein